MCGGQAHQGWRYLAPEDAPPDRSGADGDSDLPPHLAATLYQLGVF